jgi:hypothetical protein
MSAQDVFEGVVYDQNIKSKSGNAQVVQIMKADDFYRVLYESEIRPADTPHDNLQEFLQLSPSYPELLALKSVRRTLEAM